MHSGYARPPVCARRKSHPYYRIPTGTAKVLVRQGKNGFPCRSWRCVRRPMFPPTSGAALFWGQGRLRDDRLRGDPFKGAWGFKVTGPSPSPPGTSIPCAAAWRSWSAWPNSPTPTSSACRKPNAPTRCFRREAIAALGYPHQAYRRAGRLQRRGDPFAAAADAISRVTDHCALEDARHISAEIADGGAQPDDRA